MCENREGEKNNEFTETNKSKNRRNYELVEKKLKFSANLRKVSTQMETHRETERFLGGHEVFSFLMFGGKAHVPNPIKQVFETLILTSPSFALSGSNLIKTFSVRCFYYMHLKVN